MVVIVSIGAVGSDAGPTVKVIRILRALRVMRLVKRLVALRMIVAAIWASIIPVLNVFFVLMIATLVYSILGVGLFRQSSPEFFGNLSRSFFTMFQCVTGMYAFNGRGCMRRRPVSDRFTENLRSAGDGWASSVARPMMEIIDPLGSADGGGYDPGIAIFFLSYILIVSWIIVNVVLGQLCYAGTTQWLRG